MDLPANEHVFDFKMVGELTQKKYEGRFTVICVLNMLQRQLLEVEKTRLQADMSNPTDGLSGIALILSNLRIRINDGPEWWMQSVGGFDIKDENIIVALYDKVMEAETKWREELLEKAELAKTEEAPEVPEATK